MDSYIANPVTNHDDAVDRVNASIAADPLSVRDNCHTILMTHGRKTDRVLICMHGLTNCPIQFHQFGQRFFDLGYNILIPRMPHHGYLDRMTHEPSKLTVDDLKQWTDEAVATAQGLGDKVVITGISIGAVAVLWAAQTRPDVYLAAPICPAIAPKGTNLKTAKLLGRMLRAAPNGMIWWDPRIREKLTPEYVYPRFSTRALAVSFLLGAQVVELSRRSKPAAQHIKVIVSLRDPSVNNNISAQLVANWREHGADADFNALDWGKVHDVIDPDQPYAQVDKIYPLLIDLIHEPQPS